MITIIIVLLIIYLFLIKNNLNIPLTIDTCFFNYYSYQYKGKKIREYFFSIDWGPFIMVPYSIKNIIQKNIFNDRIEIEYYFRAIYDFISILLITYIFYNYFSYYSIISLIIITVYIASPINNWVAANTDYYELLNITAIHFLIIIGLQNNNLICIYFAGILVMLTYFYKYVFSIILCFPILIYLLLADFSSFLIVLTGICTALVLIIIICYKLKILNELFIQINFVKRLMYVFSFKINELGIVKNNCGSNKKKLFPDFLIEIKKNYYIYITIIFHMISFIFISDLNFKLYFSFYLFLFICFFSSYFSRFLIYRKIYLIISFSICLADILLKLSYLGYIKFFLYFVIILCTIKFLYQYFIFLKYKTNFVLKKIFPLHEFSFNNHIVLNVAEFIKKNTSKEDYIFVAAGSINAQISYLSRRRHIYDKFMLYQIRNYDIIKDRYNNWQTEVINEIDNKLPKIIVIHKNEKCCIFDYIKYNYNLINEIEEFLIYKINSKKKYNSYKIFDSNKFLFEDLTQETIILNYTAGFRDYITGIKAISKFLKHPNDKISIYCLNMRSLNLVKYLYKINNIKIEYLIDSNLEYDFLKIADSRNIKVIKPKDINNNSIGKIFINSITYFKEIKAILLNCGISEEHIYGY